MFTTEIKTRYNVLNTCTLTAKTDAGKAEIHDKNNLDWNGQDKELN